MKIYDSRKYIFIGIAVVIAGIFIARLSYLQLVADDYKQFAEENFLQKKIIYPSRGLIYDRNGDILVANETVYDLMVNPSQVQDMDTTRFCDILNISEESFKKRLTQAKRYSYYRPSVFIKQLSQATYGKFQERIYDFRGFYGRPRTARKYPEKVAPHLVGYLGEVTKEELASGEDFYKMGDYKGISGLEKSYEEILRGEKGVRHVLVDALNRNQGSYLSGELDIPSESGKDLITTLETDLQKYGETLMQNKIGSLVAIEPQTGEILAMVSSPTYNPNKLVGRERADNFQNLATDPNKPLFNRTITASYPPGSTFKPLMAVLGLSDGVLSESTTISCDNGTYISGLRIGCHEHTSPADLHYSIVTSCNSYYVHTFNRFINQDTFETVQDGFNNWYKKVSRFGFGKQLGIDLPNEKKGELPTASYYNEVYGEGRWGASTIISLGIGQGEIGATTLQLANYATVLANRGYYYTPHLGKIIKGSDTAYQKNYERHNLKTDSAHFEPVVDAMYDVVEEGTGRYYGQIEGIKVCGKTGTAQNPHGEDHSLFIAFAPKDDPEIAVGAIIENAGYGSTWAAPANTLMIEKYLKDTVERKQVEQRILDANFIEKEEAEEEEAETTTESDESITASDTVRYEEDEEQAEPDTGNLEGE